MKLLLLAILVLGSAAGCRPTAAASRVLPVIQPAPDFDLVNQDNERVRLSDLRGKLKVVSFFYVCCAVAEQCPLTTKNLKAVQAALPAAQKKDVVFLMITFDPVADTPGAIKKYGELYGTPKENWHFLTGSNEVIDQLCGQYQIIHERQEDLTIRHSLVTFLIDQDNNIRKMYFANAFTPEQVCADLGSLRERNR
ncbi:MAG: SCO family protein [Lentisphaerae bacterium]|nr:SCO family protein [Lentisphaerota bacterium]